MAKSSLMKRIERLEGKTGQNQPEVKMIFLDQFDYREKQVEVEQAEADGFFVVKVCMVPAKDGKPDPEFGEYLEYLTRK